MDIAGITPVAQDYLKVIWSATEWGDPPITTKALAARFGTTAANVSDTVKRLAAQGLVHYEPYRPVELTADGERYAIAMVRRHRLIEAFLVRTVGYGWDEVHDEAESLEHAVSDAFIDRIDALLGAPRFDPHGDPIPTADGETHRMQGATRLSHAHPGPARVVRVSDADPTLLERFRSHGLVPGADTVVDALDDDEVVLRTPVGPVTIPLDAAAAVWVVRA